MQKVILTIIAWYKKSEPVRTEFARNFHLPVHSCRFKPTCSEYMADAVTKYGALKGVTMGLKRLARCGPWSKGGFDPVK